MASFVSSTELNKARSAKRHLQSNVLASAKSDFEKKQVYLQYKKEIKEDKWMSSSLENRLKSDDRKQSSSHKHKKSHKKHKKKKKHKRSSSSDASSGDEWVERKTSSKKFDGPDINDFLGSIPTYTAQDLKEKSGSSREKINIQTKQLSSFDQPGQHSKELNPYWKSGGDGLPTTGTEQIQARSTVPDVEWLERSLRRMQEQSEDSGRTLESIASDRYGSLQAFNNLLEKARQKSGRRQGSSYESRSRRFMKPGDSDQPSMKKFKRPTSQESVPRWKKTSNLSSIESTSVSAESKIPVKTLSVNKSPTKPALHSEHKSDVSRSKLPPEEIKLNILTEEEKNKIGAKLIKAELMGNTTLIEKLKKKLDNSRKAEELLAVAENQQIPSNDRTTKSKDVDNEQNSLFSGSSCSSEDETVVLMRTTKTGQAWPLTGEADEAQMGRQRRKKKKKMKMHDKDGQRERYFADDDRYSLRDLVEQEKSGAADSNIEVISRLSAKAFTKSSGDHFTLDDMFESEAGNISTSSGTHNRQKEVAKNRKLMRRLENCKLCFGNPENLKHLIVAVGRVSYLKLPSYRALQEGHCIIAPMHHTAAGTNVDEDVWDEMRKFMQCLCNMFAKQNRDCVFIQTCSRLHKTPHFYMECIPLPLELGDVAPIYFKKAIQECESEWAQNKKLVDTRGRTVKDKIPAGLPYFAVDFGLGGGFAHVIEDESQFPDYFGREILGGMLDADPYLWRKPKDESFTDQLKRSIEFEKAYKSFDWTNTEIR